MELDHRSNSTVREPRDQKGEVSEHAKTPLRPGTPRRALGNVKNNLDTARLKTPSFSAAKAPAPAIKRVLDFDDELCSGDHNLNFPQQKEKSSKKQLVLEPCGDHLLTSRADSPPPSAVNEAEPAVRTREPDESLDLCSCTHDHCNEHYNLIDWNDSVEAAVSDDSFADDPWDQAMATTEATSWAALLESYLA
ncbi:hypothetical protein M3Y99_00803000 [Aphelenchoides fujianensis]|nr:hypothetical protein M3Y99_00803000 [Aphelenchoides fujianensis]